MARVNEAAGYLLAPQFPDHVCSDMAFVEAGAEIGEDS